MRKSLTVPVHIRYLAQHCSLDETLHFLYKVFTSIDSLMYNSQKKKSMQNKAEALI